MGDGFVEDIDCLDLGGLAFVAFAQGADGIRFQIGRGDRDGVVKPKFPAIDPFEYGQRQRKLHDAVHRVSLSGTHGRTFAGACGFYRQTDVGGIAGGDGLRLQLERAGAGGTKRKERDTGAKNSDQLVFHRETGVLWTGRMMAAGRDSEFFIVTHHAADVSHVPDRRFFRARELRRKSATKVRCPSPGGV